MRGRVMLTFLLIVVAILSATVIQQSAFAQNSNGTISADYTIQDIDNKMLKDDAKSARDSVLRLITKTIEKHEGQNNTNSTNVIFTNSLSNLTWNMVGIDALQSLTRVQLNEMVDEIKNNMTQYRFSITIESACKSGDPKISKGCTFNVHLH